MNGLPNIATSSDALSPDALRCGSSSISCAALPARICAASEYQIVTKEKVLDQTLQEGVPPQS